MNNYFINIYYISLSSSPILLQKPFNQLRGETRFTWTGTLAHTSRSYTCIIIIDIIFTAGTFNLVALRLLDGAILLFCNLISCSLIIMKGKMMMINVR